MLYICIEAFFDYSFYHIWLVVICIRDYIYYFCLYNESVEWLSNILSRTDPERGRAVNVCYFMMLLYSVHASVAALHELTQSNNCQGARVKQIWRQQQHLIKFVDIRIHFQCSCQKSRDMCTENWLIFLKFSQNTESSKKSVWEMITSTSVLYWLQNCSVSQFFSLKVAKISLEADDRRLVFCKEVSNIGGGDDRRLFN